MAVITDSIAERTAGAGVTVDGLLIKDGALPDVPGAAITEGQAAALAAYQAAVEAAEDGQVLTGDGAGGAAFEDAGGGASLSDYSNVIIVDAGGNGDYTSLAAANSAASDGDVIMLFGNVADLSVTVTKQLTIIFFGTFTGYLRVQSEVLLINPALSHTSNPLRADYDCVLKIRGGRVQSTASSAIEIRGYVEILNTHFVSQATGTSYAAVKITDQETADGFIVGSCCQGENAVLYPGFAPPLTIASNLLLGNVIAPSPITDVNIFQNIIFGAVTNVTAKTGTTVGTNFIPS